MISIYLKLVSNTQEFLIASAENIFGGLIIPVFYIQFL